MSKGWGRGLLLAGLAVLVAGGVMLANRSRAAQEDLMRLTIAGRSGMHSRPTHNPIYI